MNEGLRDSYFLIARIGILLVTIVTLVFCIENIAEASYVMLLLLAFVVGFFCCEILSKGKSRFIFFAASFASWAITAFVFDRIFVILGCILGFELLHIIKSRVSPALYVVPALIALIDNPIDIRMRILIAVLIGFVYFQHDFVVKSYQNQMNDDIKAEQKLKYTMSMRENQLQEEIRAGYLRAENEILEEKSQLAQTLHDKLGHNINGSIYQLEAVKVIKDKDPEKAEQMISAVIDQLRTGMDEIRAILRNKRPEKYQLAMLQINKLCDNCNSLGIKAELTTEGNMAEIPENVLEVILDNSYEAVSNALKYSKCSEIDINVTVLNKMVRCSVRDNGIGCFELKEGMGVEGMRRRVRVVNGTIDFDTVGGFKINMLFPIGGN